MQKNTLTGRSKYQVAQVVKEKGHLRFEVHIEVEVARGIDMLDQPVILF